MKQGDDKRLQSTWDDLGIAIIKMFGDFKDDTEFVRKIF